MIPIFDTHAHLNFEAYENDFDSLLRRLETGTFPSGLIPTELEETPIEMVGVLLPGIDGISSRSCAELAKRISKFYAAAAIHPNYVAKSNEMDWEIVTELIQGDATVAVGETGLDRYWDHTPISQQIEALWRHIELAVQTSKPILIHCRDAWEDMLPILRQAVREKGLTGVIHAFSGTPEQAEECVELGFFISFAGSVTYRNSKFAALGESAKIVPLDRLLIETDSPFMIPHPLRGKLERNEPTLTALVAHRLAELRGESVTTTANATAQNAFRIVGSRE